MVGCHLTFVPMHWAGMLGMPRRIYTYPANRGWDLWNLIASLEWATTSPPPAYNFATSPVVASRRPLWDHKHPDDPDGPHE